MRLGAGTAGTESWRAGRSIWARGLTVVAPAGSARRRSWRAWTRGDAGCSGRGPAPPCRRSTTGSSGAPGPSDGPPARPGSHEHEKLLEVPPVGLDASFRPAALLAQIAAELFDEVHQGLRDHGTGSPLRAATTLSPRGSMGRHDPGVKRTGHRGEGGRERLTARRIGSACWPEVRAHSSAPGGTPSAASATGADTPRHRVKGIPRSRSFSRTLTGVQG